MKYKIQAKSSRNYPVHFIYVLYGLDWEDCEGTENLTFEEAYELMREWEKDDRLSIRSHGGQRTRPPHDYQIVPMEGE